MRCWGGENQSRLEDGITKGTTCTYMEEPEHTIQWIPYLHESRTREDVGKGDNRAYLNFEGYLHV